MLQHTKQKKKYDTLRHDALIHITPLFEKSANISRRLGQNHENEVEADIAPRSHIRDARKCVPRGMSVSRLDPWRINGWKEGRSIVGTTTTTLNVHIPNCKTASRYISHQGNRKNLT